jgi:hypothetical protein
LVRFQALGWSPDKPARQAGLRANRYSALWVKPPAGLLMAFWVGNYLRGDYRMLYLFWISVFTIIVAFIAFRLFKPKHVIIYEYQKGLKYQKGRFAGVLNPGSYWHSSTYSMIYPVDVRPEFVTVQGQDVLSADGVTVK